METYEIIHALKQAKSQIIHLQEMYDNMFDVAFDITREHKNLGSTDEALETIDKAVEALTVEQTIKDLKG